MSSSPRLFVLVGVLVVLGTGQLGAMAQVKTAEEKKEASVAKEDPATNDAVKWLDDYRKVQVMFNKKDLDKLRAKLNGASSEQAAQWLDETKEIRKALGSPRWKESREWLKEFLRVQAMYSDDQIKHFRDDAEKAAQASPEKFIDVLLKVERERQGLIQSSANSRKLREQQVEIINAYKSDQARARDQARLAATRVQSNNTPAPPAAKREYRRPPPIVSSLDAARWGVMRGFWPGW